MGRGSPDRNYKYCSLAVMSPVLTTLTSVTIMRASDIINILIVIVIIIVTDVAWCADHGDDASAGLQ